MDRAGRINFTSADVAVPIDDSAIPRNTDPPLSDVAQCMERQTAN
jgi:hypothetical protein